MSSGISNEVLCEKLEGVIHLINEKFNNNETEHGAILEQTKKTNGRVSTLESWKAMIIGALIMTNIIILPMLFMIINNWFNGK